MAEHGFELLREAQIAEYDARAQLYRHQSGAQLLSLSNEDENKVFGITFRTPPTDSTGVAHILEHSVLCGSRKFPVKEPFVELIKGSLNTFLNAFTYPDKTCYPVASQNLQDFYNLIDVYLDAVFHPRITPQVLEQEGWHYELEDEADPLIYKGVVFNEMKGAYSAPERALYDYSQHSLFPDTTYGFESGGHPRDIPDLTFADFQDFHERFYHPANARIYFYGDDDPERRLAILEEYLSEFSPTRVESAVELQTRGSTPRRVTHPFAVSADGDGRDKCMLTVNWLLPGEADATEEMKLGILGHVLLGTPASPLRKALIESGLGEDLAGIGVEDELRQYYLSTGLKGVAAADLEKVEALIDDTLTELAEGGIDAGAIRAAVNTIEFRLRENNTGSYPRGLSLMLRSLCTWLHDGDPLAPLAFERPLAAMKHALTDEEGYLEGIIRRELLDNRHRTVVVLEPDAQLQQREETQERERLDAARAQMSDVDLRSLVTATRELKERQEAPDPPEELAKLPHLNLGDLDPEIRRIPSEMQQVDAATVLHHDLFTNGIAYLEVGFDMHTLRSEHLPFLPLLGRALTEMGTAKDDFVGLAQRIGSGTGGIWSQTLVSSRLGRPDAATWFFLRGKAMNQQAGELVEILSDILLTAQLDDKDRFLQIALEEKAGEEASLVPSGHRVVSLRLRSQFDESARISEAIGGISYLFFLRQLVQQIQDDWPSVLATLEEVRGRLINRSTMLCNVTMAQADRDAFAPLLDNLIGALPAASPEFLDWKLELNPRWEGLTVPAQVNYVGKGVRLFDHGYQVHGSASVIARYLSTTWLWDRIRVQGGAYGAFCMFDPFTGVLSCVSYRDPNLDRSLETYDGTGDFLRKVDLSADELEKAIIGAIGDMDAHQLPDAKGFTSMTRYLTDVTDEYRQTRRDEVLSTQAAEFRRFADYVDHLGPQGQVVVMGGSKGLKSSFPDLELLEVL